MKGLSPLKQTAEFIDKFTQIGPQPEFVVENQAERAREIRPKHGEWFPGQPKGSHSTHLMVSDIIGKDGKPRTSGPYYVWPSISNQRYQGPYINQPYEDQTFDQALENREVFKFDNLEEAQAFERGSWKDKHFNK